MCLIKLQSNNPKFGFIISKNPSSPMIVRDIRQGFGFGFYGTAEKYLIYFSERNGKMSYKDNPNQSFEYLNKYKYTSPVFPLNAITQFFSSSIKSKHIDDTDEFKHKLVYYSCSIDFYSLKNIKKISEYFKFINIEYAKQSPGTYKVKLSHTNIYTLLHFATIFFGIISCFHNAHDNVTDGIIEKILVSMNVLKAPYFARYIVSSRLIKNKATFSKFKQLLNTDSILIKYGNTHMQRKEHIMNHVNLKRNIIDIGCGEGYYALLFAPKLVENDSLLNYYAIDTNKEELKKVINRAKTGGINNIVTLNDYTEIYDTSNCDVLMTEVIEHNEKEYSTKLIKWVLDNLDFNKIIITVPNRDFNLNYNLEKEFRHDDHIWEPTQNEFKEFMANILKDYNNLDIQILNIGDSVDNVHVTQGMVVSKKTEKSS